MGQVPSLSTSPLGIVGDGRVARHFHHYFNLLGLPVRGDAATIAANLTALEGDPFREVYAAFARAYARRR